MSTEQLPSDQQLAQIREWIAAAKGKTYKKRDKRRYVKLCLGNQCVTMEPSEAEDWLNDGEDQTYEMSETWLTVKQYEDLPEFEGF